MAHVHWWLIILSFLLGLVFTCALMVRSTKYQVAAAASGAGADAADAETKPPAMKTATAEPREKKAAAGEDVPKKKVPGAKKKTAAAKKAAARKIAGARKRPVKRMVGAKRVPKKKVARAKRAPTEKTAVTEESSAAQLAPGRFAPYGPGSARADADGTGPQGWVVKGRTDTRHHYTPEDSSYETTCAQVWFQDEAAAARAFFTAWSKSTHRK
ncbi:hypothetical protein [Mycobacterium ulcerans]|uniref:Exported or membrane protein n=1 Tax=Mycobacterium ulcerans subsp. shinshuense TaxID=1124626 RepID=A0A1B4XZA5_MYCUL|nr:hypothetical protein [Mycobacterium ulcerans]BAV40127.1 exported or membrane protein [Mycobacterium ulcerans subsp. shinshuense]